MSLNEDILLQAIKNAAWDNCCLSDSQEQRQADGILESIREAIRQQPELLEELRPK